MTGVIGQSDLSCAVVGAGGYTGREVIRLLAGHPSATIASVFGSDRRDGGDAVADVHPSLRGICDLTIEVTSASAVRESGARVAILCTPHEVSHNLAPALLDAGMVVIDLSGAFRVGRASIYERFYGFAHTRQDLLDQAVYGLPEQNRDQIASAELTAVPGCYPTSAILALKPLVDRGAIKTGSTPIIDSVSGVSGAGRGARLTTHFCEVSLQPYGVLSHRHQPEIDEHSGTETVFTPHLGPFDRGLISTVHVDLAEGVNPGDVRSAFDEAYGAERFVRLLEGGRWPSVGAVAGTCFCDIGLGVDERKRHLIVCSAIDNLLKGAASQAVQCLNVRFGFDETAGLIPAAGQAVAP